MLKICVIQKKVLYLRLLRGNKKTHAQMERESSL